MDLDLRDELTPDSLTPMGVEEFHTTQIGSSLSVEEELSIIKILRRNMDLFAWILSNMLRIDPEIVCHQLPIDLTLKAVAK